MASPARSTVSRASNGTNGTNGTRSRRRSAGGNVIIEKLTCNGV